MNNCVAPFSAACLGTGKAFLSCIQMLSLAADLDIPNDFVPRDRATVHCRQFAHVQCVSVAFWRKHLCVSPSYSLVTAVRPVVCHVPEPYGPHVNIGVTSSSPCSLRARLFPTRFENIIRITHWFPMYEEIFRPITLERSDNILLMDMLECKRAGRKMIPYTGETHSSLQNGMKDTT